MTSMIRMQCQAVEDESSFGACERHQEEADLRPSLQDESPLPASILDAHLLRALVGASRVAATSVFFGSESVRSTSSFRSEHSSASEGSLVEIDALQRMNENPEDQLVKTEKESKTSAEPERTDFAWQERELRDLACYVHDVSPTDRPLTRNKLNRVLNKTGVTAVCRVLKNLGRVLKSRKDHDGYPIANAVVLPSRTKSVFYASESANPALSQTRSAPRQARPQIQFETVRSTQRDVDAWTMEEYMARNARSHRREHEELGGIEGNNLVNQYWNDDVGAAHDSDSN